MQMSRQRSSQQSFGTLASGIVTTFGASLAPSSRSSCSSRRPATCMVRPPTAPSMCSSEGDCDWFSNLLQIVIRPAFGREITISSKVPMYAMMEELGDYKKAKEARDDVVRYPPADRIVAIGDVHGDVDAMRDSLRMSGVIDEHDSWVGGKTVLVQVGDQLDRGSRERDIYDLLFKLQDNAPTHGGAVHILLGNHELMNTRLDFRYVTKGGFQDFARDSAVAKTPNRSNRSRIPADVMRSIRELPTGMQARAKSLCSGGPLAVQLAERTKISVIIGDNIFVHGGLTPKHLTFGGRDPKNSVATLAQLNKDVKQFLMGKGKYPLTLKGGSSPIWLRDYSRASVRAGSTECKTLGETLKMVRAKRMIVGHTPQAMGINSACGGKVWRIDTGMSAVYGGVPEAIEISKRGGVRIFTPQGVVQGSARYK